MDELLTGTAGRARAGRMTVDQFVQRCIADQLLIHRRNDEADPRLFTKRGIYEDVRRQSGVVAMMRHQLADHLDNSDRVA